MNVESWRQMIQYVSNQMFNETNKSLNDGGLNSRLSDNPPIGSQMPLKPMNHAAPYNNCVFVDR